MHCMLDLETFDVTSTSLIWQIGAVAFDGNEIHQEFHSVIKIDDQMLKQFSMSAGTFHWWLNQTEAIKVMADATHSIDDALYGFGHFFSECGAELWGNGSDFDNVILSNAYKVRGLSQPWAYGMNRCFRTVSRLHPKLDMKFEGVKHNALDDARNQAKYLIRLNKELNLNIL